MITEKQTDKIIKTIDNQVITDFLINDDNFFDNSKPSDYGITSWEEYKKGFSERNTLSFERFTSLIKSYPKDDFNSELEEINEEDTERFLNLISVKKALSVNISFTEGIVYALRVSLDSLYYNSQYIFTRLTDKLNNPDQVRSINLFLLFVKMVKDDLRFITYGETGEISTVPLQIIKKTDLKKYYETYVSSYDVQRINDIYQALQSSMALLDVFLQLIPENPEFDFFKKTIQTALDCINIISNDFKELMLIANALNIVCIAPKEVSSPSPELPWVDDDLIKSTALKKKLSGNLPIDIKKATQGLITGIILEPGDEENRDLHDQFISKEEIEKANIFYMSKHQNLGLMHKSLLKSNNDPKPQATLIMNWITHEDTIIGGEIVKDGTWLQQWQILDKKLKKKVDSGEYTGFSIGGEGEIKPDEV